MRTGEGEGRYSVGLTPREGAEDLVAEVAAGRAEGLRLAHPLESEMAAPSGDTSVSSTGTGEAVQPRFRFRGAGGFILDTPETPTAVWGSGSSVLIAQGEACILAGVQGTGKSTIGQQIALGRAGFTEYGDLLGYPIQPGLRRVLYLAMDRPRQIARSMRRMVGEAWRAELDAKVRIWEGPPPADLAQRPDLLVAMALEADADTVIVDSLKDAAVGLNDDAVGAAWNRARQMVIAREIEIVELHHNRKAGGGQKRDRLSLDDVYGSTWITSGAGSVLLLTGEPGDPVVALHHVKQPADEVGPLSLLHDHEAGRTTIFEEVNVAAAVKARGTASAKEVAAVMFGTKEPTNAQREKARRRLERLVKDGVLQVVDEGDQSAGMPRKWGAP